MSEDRVYLVDLDDCATWSAESGRWVTLREAMTEPTIDEMLAWVQENRKSSAVEPDAIRAILEMHRDEGFAVIPRSAVEQLKLEAIRAFVERVENRWRGNWDAVLAEHIADPSRSYWYKAMRDELAAMEKENAGTND